MFDRWRRRKAVSQAENYIKATDNVSRPIAILLSLAAIIIIAALIFALFLGGRWVYNRISGNDEPTTSQTDSSDDQGDEQLEFPGFVEDGQNTESDPNAGSQNQNTTVPNTGPAIIPDTGPGTSE